jgi:hypothetical protein
MGLETVHPNILPKLNKRMTLHQFSTAAAFLRAHDMGLRVFVLVQPPFMEPHESVFWAQRTVDFAFDCGATAVTLIPTRGGNGAMEALAANHQFSPPRLETLEASFSCSLALKRGRIFADLWNTERIPSCPVCRIPRIARLHQMNLCQINLAPAHCQSCAPAN